MSRKRLIWRVETRDGYGMYFYDSLTRKAGLSMVFSERHPSPFQDSILSLRWETTCLSGGSNRWFFGFGTLEQLKRWTDSHRLKMDECGFVVRVYSVYKRSSIIGDKQAVFKKHRSKLVGEFSPLEVDVVTSVEEYNADLFEDWSRLTPKNGCEKISS